MRTIVTTAVATAFGLVCASACNRSDVGAPCQHAGGDLPAEPLISFPALACDQLLCVFGETLEPPEGSCSSDADCVTLAGGDDAYVCVESRCQVGAQAVLERSMCSTTCESDLDCAAFDDDTRCANGFMCAPLMTLGDFCCESVCVCRDDVATGEAETLAAKCAASDVPGCCDQDPKPEACG
ncbi:MAG: hypothetical protein AAGA54_11060 [Myxococcota bacterium]